MWTILEDALPPDVTMFDLAVDPSALWEEQRSSDSSLTRCRELVYIFCWIKAPHRVAE